ncbi:hypothetical protein NDU88_000802 [Pleurodeles waltl]|uniref:Uncharacterized protein n=1 Tax=Pleurodeles waltl TaxID=8319 RepID=A0AAV7R602_PLEWA|nr:hypothetical protein NDU88_000802 [Pleurodeles waltl]
MAGIRHAHVRFDPKSGSRKSTIADEGEKTVSGQCRSRGAEEVKALGERRPRSVAARSEGGRKAPGRGGQKSGTGLGLVKRTPTRRIPLGGSWAAARRDGETTPGPQKAEHRQVDN